MTTSKNILWLIDGLGMGGAERLMVPYLRHLDRRRFTPRVCVLQERDGNPVAEQIRQLGIPVDLLPVSRLRNPGNLPRLWRYLRRHRIDLAHTQLEFANTLGTLAARMGGIPAVCTLHTFDNLAEGGRAGRRIRLMWWALRHFSRRIIAVSEEIRQYHIQAARFDPERVVTLYNGIDLARFRCPPGAARAGLGIPPDVPLLLTVAVLRQPKGIQYMLAALPEVLAAVPQAWYLVVGDGAYAGALRQAARQYGVAERVIFAGARPDVPQLLAASDLFVLPTLLDALPTVLIEALAAGKPVVASRVGGVPEIVSDGRSGLLVPPAQPDALARACIQLLQARDLAERMGRAGRETAGQKFDIRRQAARLGELYLEALA